VKKTYKSLVAVDSLNLEIKEGELFGLLGPNGAGKTTLISMLSTIRTLTEGQAFVNGYDVVKEKDSVRKSIGIVFQDTSLDDELTGKENLDFHGRLYAMNRELREKRISEVLELVELSDKANIIVKTYSGGMRRRLEIARGLMHHPKVLFLDEPTLGLDPQTRRSIWDYIEKLNRQENITMILTTHYMEEADYLCDRIAIIDHGKIIALDTPENLKNSVGGDIITLNSSDNSKLLEELKSKKWILDLKENHDSISIKTKNGDEKIIEIMKLPIEIKSISVKKPTLEDVFINYTGRKIREEAADYIPARMRVMRR
jgi:ABC-2 type transport system ATP-binding protein